MTCDLRIKYDEVLKRRAAELFADGHGHTSVARLSSIVHGDESLLPCGLPNGLRATGDGRRHGGRKVCAWSRAPAAVLEICCTAVATVLARGCQCLGSAKVYPAKTPACIGWLLRFD